MHCIERIDSRLEGMQSEVSTGRRTSDDVFIYLLAV